MKISRTSPAARGGDIGFAGENELKQNGFPPELITQFFDSLAVGGTTTAVRFVSPQFPNGRWYIFKLKRKQLQSENLTLDSPGVRQQIAEALTNQRKQLLNQALCLVIIAFTNPCPTNSSLLIKQKDGGPGFHFVTVPCFVFVIRNNGVPNPQ